MQIKIRKSKKNKLLLLGCPLPGLKGKIALGRYSCIRWHIAIRTDHFQHPGCVEFQLTGGRGFENYAKTDTSKYSKCYIVKGGSGSFDVRIRWHIDHSPYPEIKDMAVWVFGIFLGNLEFPKAPDDWKTVAHVEISADGRVTVNGHSAGIWEEFTEETK